MTTNNVSNNLQAAQDAQDALRQNKTAATSQKKEAVKEAGLKIAKEEQKKETASNSTNPAAKVDISPDAKQAAGAEGKTTEKAKQVNPYANANTAQDIRKVTNQLMSKAKAPAAAGDAAKTTEKAAATEGKTAEKAKPVNAYDQLMNKTKSRQGLRAVV